MSQKVAVAVSEAMRRLRETQHVLNNFLWSTELCYGYVLTEVPTKFTDLDSRTSQSLSYIPSEAWYLNNQGKVKYDRKMSEFLLQVQSNTVHIFRAVIVYFHSAFETYLEERRGKGKWAPYCLELSSPDLFNAPYPVRPESILRADVVRLIRNMIVHSPFLVPTSYKDPSVHDFRRKLEEFLAHKRKPVFPGASAVYKQVLGEFIGQAENHVKIAAKLGKTLPIEQFYALFTLTDLDTLAFEIEEALNPDKSALSHWIRRKEDDVYRKEQIIDEFPWPRDF